MPPRWFRSSKYAVKSAFTALPVSALSPCKGTTVPRVMLFAVTPGCGTFGCRECGACTRAPDTEALQHNNNPRTADGNFIVLCNREASLKYGDPGRSRTCDLRFR